MERLRHVAASPLGPDKQPMFSTPGCGFGVEVQVGGGNVGRVYETAIS